MTGRRSIEDLVEGHHLASILLQLHELGVLDALGDTATAESLSEQSGLDGHLLSMCLELLAAWTDLVNVDGAGFRTSDRWDESAAAYLEQYVGAYGRQTSELASILRDTSTGPDLVDRRRHATSFLTGGPAVRHLVADVVLQLELSPVLDLGCGTGALLVELAERDPTFDGAGVDASDEMCAAADERIALAGVAAQVTVTVGDAFRPDRLDLGTAGFAALTACSLLNELWNPDDDRPSVAEWLQAAAERFPGAAVVVADYYGRLGHTPPPWPRRTALHDLVQALSGQGVPPADRHGWIEQYEAADAQLLHMVEDEERTCFVHLLKLPGRLSGRRSSASASP